MTRPFNFKINAAELYAEIHPLTQKEKALWITNFCNDLITLKPVLSYSAKIITETAELIEKKKMAGSLGGRPKKAEVKQRLSKTKAQPKLEVEVKEEVKTEEVKHGYRDNVTLTEKEYSSLITKYGQPRVDLILDKLDSYKLATGKKYVSDYGAINQWVVGAVQKTLPQQQKTYVPSLGDLI